MSLPLRDTPTEQIAAFIHRTHFADLSDNVQEGAKLTILDTLGVALAAAYRPISSSLLGYLCSNGEQGVCTGWGTDLRLRMSDAAYVNGFLSNALDFDEGSHLATHALPAAFAVAQATGKGGAELIEAYVVAREFGWRLTSAFDGARAEGKGPTARGWWHVGVAGPLVAAAAAARVLELEESAIINAIGTATSASGGFRQNLGTMAKALHSAQAARCGVESALLAQGGFTSDPTAIEGSLGLLRAITYPDEPDFEVLTRELGSSYEFDRPLRIKPYPSVTPGHCAIDALVGLINTHGIRREAIAQIRVHIEHRSLLHNLPINEVEAGFSMPFLLACAIAFGTVTLDQMTLATVEDPEIHELMQLVQDDQTLGPGEVHIEMQNGTSVDSGPTPTRRLVGIDAVAEKFMNCSNGVLDPARAARVIETVLSFEKFSSLDELGTLLQATSKI